MAERDGMNGRAAAAGETRDERPDARFFNLSSALLVEAGFDGRFHRANAAWEQALGWTAAELTSRPWLDFVHPDDVAHTVAADERVRSGTEVVEFENRYRHKDGSYRWISWNVSPALAQQRIYGVAQDITTRKEMEEDLRRSLDTFFNLIQNAPFGVYLVDGDFRLSHVSAGAQKVFSNVQPLIGRDFADVLRIVWPDPVASEAIARFRHTLASGEPFHHADTTELRSDTDDVHLYDWRIERVALPDGQFGVVCYFYDTTELKQAGQALRATETRYRTLFDSIDEGFCVCELLVDEAGGPRDYRFCEVNPMFERHTGLRNATGKTALELVPNLERKWIDTYARVALTREPTRFEQGSEVMGRWFDVYAFPFGNPAQRTFGVILKDVSDQRRKDVELRESEQRFRELADDSPMFVWIADRDANVTYVNRTLLRFVGAEADEYAGRAWARTLHPEDVERALQTYAAAVRDRVPYTIEVRYRDSTSGEYQWHLIKGVPRIVGGRFAGMMGTGINIHDRKLAEEALESANRRKDEFLATLAHELRNPLAPLRSGLELMRIASQNKEVVERSRAMMERQLAQMVRLIDDLLDASRIARGKVKLRKERLAIGDVIAQAVETSKPRIDAVRQTLRLHAPPDPIFVHADATRLTQVFANLLDNASKFTPAEGRITVTTSHEETSVRVSVKDNGIGMKPDVLANVFDLFMQADTSPSRERGGLGIGLSLVRGLVELHGGSVEASSRDGNGSEFIVHLPTALTLVTESPASEAPRKISARRRILVVDDNSDAATSLAMMLSAMGNETQMACSATEALEAGAAFRPDVVVLDIGMPRVTGYDAARMIREKDWGRNVVLIALTGWGQEGDRRQSAEAGFHAHLVKPADPQELETLLASLGESAGAHTGRRQS
ncbi:MAG TPA: PAS domain S-box protein [Casimicrobiaceae bacterium]|nr:PAS domain S-box protein [Casimicrobiaceae bacterium]